MQRPAARVLITTCSYDDRVYCVLDRVIKRQIGYSGERRVRQPHATPSYRRVRDRRSRRIADEASRFLCTLQTHIQIKMISFVERNRESNTIHLASSFVWLADITRVIFRAIAKTDTSQHGTLTFYCVEVSYCRECI